jgi:hypothetical protein
MLWFVAYSWALEAVALRGILGAFLAERRGLPAPKTENLTFICLPIS